MHLQTQPVSPAQEVPAGSDIANLRFEHGGLTVLLAREPLPAGEASGLRITFAKVAGFRYLDESQLTRYWTSDEFSRGHHVLAVDAGGWLAEECQLEGYDYRQSEWLLVTGNACVSVFAAEAPVVEGVVIDAG